MLAAVHHHLIRNENRMKVGLIVEAGDVREVHHVALLIGYGASAINPYLAMETVRVPGPRAAYITGITPEKAVANLIKALGKGVLKIMSKMGISTVSSYAGAQAFEAVGLTQEFVDQYFTGTTSQARRSRHRRRSPPRTSRGTRSAYPEDAAITAHERLRDRRRVPVAPRGPAAPLQPGDGVPAAALDAHAPLRHLPRVHRSSSTTRPRSS